MFVFSCGKSEKAILLDKFNNITKSKQKKFYVVIVSDSDCSSCIGNVIKKVSKLNASEVYGIYFKDPKAKYSFSGHIERIINQKKPPFKWIKSNDISLMNLLYKNSGIITGPYLVKITEKECINIDF